MLKINTLQSKMLKNHASASHRLDEDVPSSRAEIDLLTSSVAVVSCSVISRPGKSPVQYVPHGSVALGTHALQQTMTLQLWPALSKAQLQQDLPWTNTDRALNVTGAALGSSENSETHIKEIKIKELSKIQTCHVLDD